MSRSHANQYAIAGAERSLEFLRLRREGNTYAEIGEKMGVCLQRAYQIVNREFDRLRKTVTETAEECRQIDLERMDGMLKAVWPAANMGNLKACETVLKILAQRSRLLGLDAPTKVKLSQDIEDMSEGELREEARRRGIKVIEEVVHDSNIEDSGEHGGPGEEGSPLLLGSGVPGEEDSGGDQGPEEQPLQGGDTDPLGVEPRTGVNSV